VRRLAALMIALAARYRLPAVYYDRYFVEAGGLISYGSNSAEQFRLAATYVDRIPQGREACRLASGNGKQIRACHQP